MGLTFRGVGFKALGVVSRASRASCSFYLPWFIFVRFTQLVGHGNSRTNGRSVDPCHASEP